ncbi:hypothetical protein I0C86_04300 [Plantactinospora sp. S1510]|uniref:DUF4115 domain-containing protein n=1 Tax=Plantactinospora alkalitolerans TaxID=2789879 RepID=A0ABS0GPU8_9ACTN|nr:hypothetical protein [Plantactinospora alkalitolerans]MBF9128218.1 hypothetical protein [Plantactinospora alkalitolerans]
MTDDGHRKRRISPAVTIAAVSAVILVAVVAVIVAIARSRPVPPHPLPSPRPPSPAAAPIVRAATDRGTSVRLTAAIVPEQGWIRLRSTVVGAQPGREYRIVALTTDGTRVPAAAWIGSDANMLEGVTVDGTIAVPLSEIASVVVFDADDRRYVSVSFN